MTDAKLTATAMVAAPVTAPLRKPHARIPELDGVRAIAIWMVLIAHLLFGFPSPEGAFARMPGAVYQVLSHGWLGVDLFFVLSGFLITGILLDSRQQPHYFRNFYIRRVLRILPVYFATVLLLALFYQHAWPFVLVSSVFLANFAFVLGVHTPMGADILWSLAVEEHFYFAWPWLVRIFSRKGITVMALSLVVTEPLLRYYAALHGVNVEDVIYKLSFFRFDGLALGALLAIWYRSRRYSVSSSVLLALGMLTADLLLSAVGMRYGLMGRSTPLAVAFRFNQAQVFFAAGMLGVLAFQGRPGTALFRSRFAVLSGNLSYCIYLIHLAIGDAYEHTLALRIAPWVQNAWGPAAVVAVRVVVVLLATFGLAMLSRRYLEQPFLRLKNRFA